MIANSIKRLTWDHKDIIVSINPPIASHSINPDSNHSLQDQVAEHINYLITKQINLRFTDHKDSTFTIHMGPRHAKDRDLPFAKHRNQ